MDGGTRFCSEDEVGKIEGTAVAFVTATQQVLVTQYSTELWASK